MDASTKAAIVDVIKARLRMDDLMLMEMYLAPFRSRAEYESFVRDQPEFTSVVDSQEYRECWERRHQ